MQRGAEAQRLSARQRADDEEWLRADRDGIRQRRIGGLVRKVFLAGEESHERTAAKCHVIADRPSKHGMPRFEGVEHRTERRRAGNVDLHITVHARQRAEMRGQFDPDHDSVCTSTANTGGKSRTIGVQLSPLSADA